MLKFHLESKTDSAKELYFSFFLGQTNKFQENTIAIPNQTQHHSSFHLPAHSNAGLVFLLC